MPTRTFLALDIDEAILGHLAVAAERLNRSGARVRWTAPENLHVTVKFIGDVLDEDMPRVCEVAAEVASQIGPFEFTVGDIVSMPPAGHMRMVWVEIGDATGRMTELANGLNDAYAAMGYKAENRAFCPHLTLGRVKGGANVSMLRAAIAKLPAADFEPQYADELVVYASELTREGPIYTPLSRAPLSEE